MSKLQSSEVILIWARFKSGEVGIVGAVYDLKSGRSASLEIRQSIGTL